jgi:hypothetical protein
MSTLGLSVGGCRGSATASVGPVRVIALPEFGYLHPPASKCLDLYNVAV